MKNVADKTKNPLLQLYSYIYQAQSANDERTGKNSQKKT